MALTSNPVVEISNVIPLPSYPSITRTTYTRIVFTDEQFFLYADGEWSAGYGAFDPGDMGERSLFFVNLYDAFGGDKTTEIIGQEAWDTTLRYAPSGFLTAVYSVMPKLIIPSQVLVDNGWDDRDNWKAYWDTDELFNWSLEEFNGGTALGGLVEQLAGIGGEAGSKYVVMKGKNDSLAGNSLRVELDNPSPEPEGEWISDKLVVEGAFCVLLNITPSATGKADPAAASEVQWSVELECGEIKITLQEGGAMEVQVAGGDANGNWTKSNLSDGQAKEGPPQRQHITDKSPIILTVYPVWNGVVVSSGVQDTSSVVDVTSTYCPKIKGASILNDTYSDEFDPLSPGNIVVETDGGAVMVDFGDELEVTANNCRCELAYLPAFFSHRCWLDEWFLGPKDTGNIGYEFYVYAIWGQNDTASTINHPPASISAITKPGPPDNPDVEYRLVQWRLQQTAVNRFAGELFGSILRVDEEQTFTTDNDNGSFEINWTPGTNDPASPDGGLSGTDWVPFIQSLQVSLSADGGSSGSITVDKHGLAGQDAVADQSIGACVVKVTNAPHGCHLGGGFIFHGLAMGISDSQDTGGGTWTVPLVGLEKKLEEIVLVNPPFFDGFTIGSTFDLLTRFAGVQLVVVDPAWAANTKLTSSTDIGNPIFNFKIGQSVLEAMRTTADNVLGTFYCHDGAVYLYEVDEDTGLPVYSISGGAPDWEPDYPNTKVVSASQSPEFEDLRNRIVTIGVDRLNGGTGTKITDLPLFPNILLLNQATVPEIPWEKAMVKGVSGYTDDDSLRNIAERLASASRRYEISGSTTIPGNADIRPYDRWGSYVIVSVSHSIDFTGKTWTTDLEFATGEDTS